MDDPFAPATTGGPSEGLLQLCEALALAPEDVCEVPGSEVGVARLLVQLVDESSAPGNQLLAARALTHLCEGLGAAAISAAVAIGAVPVLCAKLSSIACMDLAEQSLRALRVLVEPRGGAGMMGALSLVQSGGESAVLLHVAFFPLALQRVAAEVAEAGCACMARIGMRAEAVVDALCPLLEPLLSSPDAGVLAAGLRALLHVLDLPTLLPGALAASLEAAAFPTAVMDLLPNSSGHASESIKAGWLLDRRSTAVAELELASRILATSVARCPALVASLCAAGLLGRITGGLRELTRLIRDRPLDTAVLPLAPFLNLVRACIGGTSGERKGAGGGNFEGSDADCIDWDAHFDGAGYQDGDEGGERERERDRGGADTRDADNADDGHLHSDGDGKGRVAEYTAATTAADTAHAESKEEAVAYAPDLQNQDTYTFDETHATAPAGDDFVAPLVPPLVALCSECGGDENLTRATACLLLAVNKLAPSTLRAMLADGDTGATREKADWTGELPCLNPLDIARLCRTLVVDCRGESGAESRGGVGGESGGKSEESGGSAQADLQQAGLQLMHVVLSRGGSPGAVGAFRREGLFVTVALLASDTERTCSAIAVQHLAVAVLQANILGGDGDGATLPLSVSMSSLVPLPRPLPLQDHSSNSSTPTNSLDDSAGTVLHQLRIVSSQLCSAVEEDHGRHGEGDASVSANVALAALRDCLVSPRGVTSAEIGDGHLVNALRRFLTAAPAPPGRASTDDCPPQSPMRDLRYRQSWFAGAMQCAEDEHPTPPLDVLIRRLVAAVDVSTMIQAIPPTSTSPCITTTDGTAMRCNATTHHDGSHRRIRGPHGPSGGHRQGALSDIALLRRAIRVNMHCVHRSRRHTSSPNTMNTMNTMTVTAGVRAEPKSPMLERQQDAVPRTKPQRDERSSEVSEMSLVPDYECERRDSVESESSHEGVCPECGIPSMHIDVAPLSSVGKVCEDFTTLWQGPHLGERDQDDADAESLGEPAAPCLQQPLRVSSRPRLRLRASECLEPSTLLVSILLPRCLGPECWEQEHSIIVEATDEDEGGPHAPGNHPDTPSTAAAAVCEGALSTISPHAATKGPNKLTTHAATNVAMDHAATDASIHMVAPPEQRQQRQQRCLLDLLVVLDELCAEWSHRARWRGHETPRSAFTHRRLTAQMTEHMTDVLAVASGCFPSWCTVVLSKYPFLCPTDVRKRFFAMTGLGRMRGLVMMEKVIGPFNAETERIGMFDDDDDDDDLDSELSFTREDRGYSGMSFTSMRVKEDLQRPIVVPTVRVRVSRSDAADTVRTLLGSVQGAPMLGVEFVGESGTGLGPTLELFTMLGHYFVDNRRASMWRSVDEALFPAPVCSSGDRTGKHVDDILKQFTFLGRVLAQALLDGRRLDIELSRPLLAALCGSGRQLLGRSAWRTVPPTHGIGAGGTGTAATSENAEPDVAQWLSVLEQVDEQLARSLRHMVDLAAPFEDNGSCGSGGSGMLNDRPALGVRGVRQLRRSAADVQEAFRTMHIDFTLPGHPDVELIPGGRTTMVSRDNVGEYITLACRVLLVDGVRAPVEALLVAFDDKVPLSSIQGCFNEDELGAMLCGSTARIEDVGEGRTLRDTIRFEHGFHNESPVADFLDAFLRDASTLTQRAFLRFVTGSPRLPPGGLAELKPPLTVVRKDSGGGGGDADRYLPSAGTCFNNLKVPAYSSQAVFTRQVMVAITDGQGAFALS